MTHLRISDLALERPGTALPHKPAQLFMAGGAVLCLLAAGVLLMQPQPELLSLHRSMALACLVTAGLFAWFARATSATMADQVLLAAVFGIALVVALAWALGTGLRTIVLGIIPLLVALSTLLAGGWRAAVVAATGVAGLAALAWRDHTAGAEPLAAALGRLTLASGIWAHVVLLLGGLIFGLVARMVAQRWRRLSEEREQQFRELLMSAADRYLELDADLRFLPPSIVMPSPAGPLPPELIGRHPWDAPGLRFDGDEAARHRADLLARRPFDIEVTAQHGPDLPVVRLAISGRPRFSSQGQFLGYWCAGRDVTALQRQREAAQRATAEAEAASRAKSSFLANMSHEVRTPLNGILGLARLARQHVDDRERLVEYLELIGNSASALHATLTDVLDLSRAEANQLTLSPQRVDLHALLDELHRSHEALGRARGLACTLSIDPGLPRQVHTDGGRLRQILTNYLHNALKFTTQGGIAIEATGIGPGRWRFAVHDTGCGLPASALPQLFRPFSQFGQPGSQGQGGSGLGLSICRQLARALGGDVGVSSEPGRGSRFWVDLPLVALADEAPAETAATPASLAGLRALVAEDNPVNMLITVATLQDWGATVSEAADGRAALAQVARAEQAGQPFDVVLMDLHMPELDGLAATRALRASGVRTPVVGLTASVLDDVRQQAREAGFDDVLAKPIEAKPLQALLAELTSATLEARRTG